MKRTWMIGLATTLVFGSIGCEGAFDDSATDGRGDEVQLDGELTIQQAWSTGTFSGDLGIRASWSGSADLDLYVETPDGEILYYGNRSSRSGGAFTKNACQTSQCRRQTSEEVSFLTSAPSGEFKVWVERYDNRSVEDLVIEVSRAGAIEQSFSPELAGNTGAESQRVSFDVRPLPIESVYGGELAIQLTWEGSADLDLLVLNPNGEQVYYGRRNDSFGGRLTKNECLLNRCQHSASEEVRWDTSAPMGQYEVRIANYNGAAARNVKVRVHKHRQIIGDHDIDVPTRRSASVGPIAVDYASVPLTPNGVQFDIEDESWLTGTSHRFSGRANDAGIVHAELVVNGRSVAEASGDSYDFSHTFSQLGQQSVEIMGYSADGMLMAIDRKTLVVTDANGGLPRRGTGARDVSRSLLAKRILERSRIELNTILPSGERERLPADSYSNMRDAVMGTSRTSCYGNANCTDVYLDETLLQTMLMIEQRHGYGYSVTTIAGGSHSSRSRHYSGIAFDANYINGNKISFNTRTLNRQFMDLCRSYGATEVLGPGDAGHSGHIHCAWPR